MQGNSVTLAQVSKKNVGLSVIHNNCHPIKCAKLGEYKLKFLPSLNLFLSSLQVFRVSRSWYFGSNDVFLAMKEIKPLLCVIDSNAFVYAPLKCLWGKNYL